MSLERYDERSPISQVLQYSNSDAALTFKDAQAVSAVGGRVDCIVAVNTDVSDHDLYVGIRNASGGRGVIGILTVPAGAGWTGTTAIDVLATLLPAAVQFIQLEGLNNVYFANVDQMPSDTYLNILVMGGHF